MIQLDEEPRPADEELVARDELLLALDADEDARARAEVGEQDRPGLLLDEAVLLADERIAREDEVAVARCRSAASCRARARTRPATPPSKICTTRNDESHLGDE